MTTNESASLVTHQQARQVLLKQIIDTCIEGAPDARGKSQMASTVRNLVDAYRVLSDLKERP